MRVIQISPDDDRHVERLDLLLTLDDVAEALKTGDLRNSAGDKPEAKPEFSPIDLLVWSVNQRLRLSRDD